jgi:hypothetical protein
LSYLAVVESAELLIEVLSAVLKEEKNHLQKDTGDKLQQERDQLQQDRLEYDDSNDILY